MVLRRWAITKLVRPFSSVSKRLLDQALGARVHAGGGFVQDQDARVGQRGAGDREQLALSLAQAGAAFAQHGLVLLRQALDERYRRAPAWPRHSTSSSVASGRPKRMLSITVVLNRKVSCSTMPICWRRRFGGHVAHVDAVDRHRAAGHIVEARIAG